MAKYRCHKSERCGFVVNNKSMSSKTKSGYRVLFIVDATTSMGEFLNSLTASLYQVASIMKLTNESESSIGVLWYRDYDQPVGDIFGFSGYTNDVDELLTFLTDLQPCGGRDHPEATKTALNATLDLDLIDAKTIVLLYTDAPPHHSRTGSRFEASEKAIVKEYDWIRLCELFERTGCRVYSIINVTDFDTASFYLLLSHYTRGQTLFLHVTDVKTISKATINLFLSLYQAKYEPTEAVECLTFADMPVDSFESEDQATHDSFTYLPARPTIPLAPILHRPFHAEPIDFMIADLKLMLSRFKSDPTYQTTVYQVLQSLMTPQHVLALTHNSILGSLWRLVCAQRHDQRREHLLVALSKTLNAMTDDAAIVRTWLNESYDSAEEICTRIAEISEHVPALVLTLTQAMERRELLEITRSCNPHVLRTVMNLLNHLTVVTQPDNLPARYLPLMMDDMEIFQTLPHLFAEGLKVSMRSAALMAMLCVLSKNRILSERAERFLLDIKGEWIDLEASENYSYSFIKLCVQLPMFFTEKEIYFFWKFSAVGGLKINASTRLMIQQPFHPTFTSVYRDTKLACPTCHILRSTTLFPDVATSCCAFCLLENNDLRGTPETCADDASHLAECRSCMCLYAVVQYTKLKCEPKCYYCRHRRTAPFRQCTSCSNKYVHFDSTAPTTTFVCAECEQSTTAKTIVDEQVELKSLLDANQPAILRHLNIRIAEDIDILSTQWSLFKLKGKVKLVKNTESKSNGTLLLHDKKPVVNSSDVLKQIRDWVKSGRSEFGMCYICCDDLPRDRMNPTCGNKSCHADACEDCVSKWYQPTVPGGLVLPAHLLCPFCKNVPTVKVLKRYNRQACTILKFDVKNKLNERWYYGWCLDCYRIRKAQKKSCRRDGGVPELKEFVCDECADRRHKELVKDVKLCPGWNNKSKKTCGVAIVKNGGCNHIACTICGTHWCWLCVKSFEDDIYEHLMRAHGNYGFDD